MCSEAAIIDKDFMKPSAPGGLQSVVPSAEKVVETERFLVHILDWRPG